MTDLNPKERLLKALKGEAYDNTGLIYGVGHAVYTISDPRAILLKDMARKLAEEKEYIENVLSQRF